MYDVKREKKFVDGRRSEIMAFLRERREVSVTELTDHFQTSAMTIRRDLRFLEDRMLVERFYGGVRSLESEKPLTREEEIIIYRDLIACAAAKLINENDTVFINGSSTALGLIRYLGEKHIHIVTNNAKCVNMPRSENTRVVLTGGQIYNNSGILVGDHAMRNLLSEHADKAFCGFAGISGNGEVACDIPTEIGINELMASHCKELYIMVDYTKVGKTSNYASCSLEKQGTLITDEKADPEVIRKLREHGMKVLQVSMKDRMLI